MSKETTTLVIPDEHYVAFIFRDSDIYPLGFLVPEGKTKADQNKKATADRWAQGSKIKVPAKVFKNEPMVGFEIRKTVTHYRSKGANIESWRVIDPRGFELEISNSNMEFIINYCVIHKGEIISKCLWARESGSNMLLPVDSPEYKNAMSNTDRINSKISLRDIKIGDHVTAKDGLKARFLGKYTQINTRATYYSDPVHHMLEQNKNKVFAVQTDDGKIQLLRTFTVSYLHKSEPISEKDAEKLVNDKYNEDAYARPYGSLISILTFDKATIDDVSMELIDIDNFDELYSSGCRNFLIDDASMIASINALSNRQGRPINEISMHSYVVSSVDLDKKIINLATEKTTYLGMQRDRIKSLPSTTFDKLQIGKCQRVKFKYSTKIGNDLEIDF